MAGDYTSLSLVCEPRMLTPKAEILAEGHKGFWLNCLGGAVARTRRQVSVAIVKEGSQFFETFEAFCSKALCIPVSRIHAQDRTDFMGSGREVEISHEPADETG
jgi:hypothetical protein